MFELGLTDEQRGVMHDLYQRYTEAFQKLNDGELSLAPRPSNPERVCAQSHEQLSTAREHEDDSG